MKEVEEREILLLKCLTTRIYFSRVHISLFCNLLHEKLAVGKAGCTLHSCSNN